MALDQETATSEFDLAWVRRQYPSLGRRVDGKKIVYLDSAATSLTPTVVIEAVSGCYETLPGTVGRGVYSLNIEATERFDAARQTIADFINAEPDEVVFVRNSTEAINLVSNSLPADSKVLASIGEHHSNLLPWRTRHALTQVTTNEQGIIDLADLESLARSGRPSLITCSTISNAVGGINPIEAITHIAKEHGAEVLLDASQSAAHEVIDVRQLDCDFLCFSSHKIGGPSGVGILYAKREKLKTLRPMLIGGGAVDNVTIDDHTLANGTERFEAGTPAFEATIGFAAACEFIDAIGRDRIRMHEEQLTKRLIEKLSSVDRVNVIGPHVDDKRGPIVAFHIDGMEAHGAARILSNRSNVFVRSGFHCAQPGHEVRGWRPTIRASFGVYNEQSEVDVLVEALQAITANLSS